MDNKNSKINNLPSFNSTGFSNKTLFLLLFFTMATKPYIFIRKVFDLVPNKWQNQQLTVDYSYGFIRRGFLGSLVTLIKKCFNTDYLFAIKAVQFIGLILFTVSILIFFYALLRKEHGKTFWFITLVFISLDCFGFQISNFGSNEMFIIPITVFAVCLIIKDKALFLIPLLAGICVLIHEGFPMMYFSIFVSMLIYRFCYAESKKLKIRYATVFIITGLVVSALFIYSYFIHPRIETTDVETVLNTSRERIGGDFDIGCFMQLWFDPSFERFQTMWINGRPTEDFFIMMRIVIMNTIVCIPLIVMTARYWIKLIKNEPVLYRKFLLVLCSLSVFLVLPLIISENDQGRWVCSVVFFEIVLISSTALLNCNNEKEVLSGLSKFSVAKVILLLFYTAYFFTYPGYELNYISIHLVKLYPLIFK